MRVLLTIEQRFSRDSTGAVYANGVFNYAFFARYLEVFDEVAVCARVCREDGAWPPSYRADGPRVTFVEVPYYIGPIQYLKKRRPIQAVIANAVRSADAFILRVPGTMGFLVGRELRKRNIPYGVEVVGDPWDALGACSGRSVLKPFLRVDGYWTMRGLCASAAVAAYVTDSTLQKRYPPGDWSTSYSSVELAGDHLLDANQMEKRHAFLREPFQNQRAFRICNVGSMEALYKAQDTLIEAVALCRQKGLSIELTLAGDGRYRGVFEQRAKALQVSDHIHFLGNVPTEEVRRTLDGSDLFVLPSLTEGLPRVLIEAMARGLPCLASRVGGNSELLSPDYLFVPRQADRLAQKIEWCLGDYEHLQEAARANRNRACDYSAEKMTRKRNECYQRLRTLMETQSGSSSSSRSR
jgi:glycosyltransferase involved in cell wall biosynthesis